jgi:flagellar FliL protein
MWKSASGEGEAPSRRGPEPDAAADGGEERPAKAGSPLGKKLIIMLVAGLVLAGGGIGAAKFLGGGDGGGKAREQKVEEPLAWEFTDLVVNIYGTKDTRLLRCVMLIEVDNPKAREELKLREVVFRDAILEILRSKTIEDLKYPGENAIKRQVRDRFNRMMVNGSVVEVYLKDFLVH